MREYARSIGSVQLISNIILVVVLVCSMFLLFNEKIVNHTLENNL